MSPRIIVLGSVNADLVVQSPKLPSAGETVLAHVFPELGEQLEACFDGVTFADLCARADSLGLAPQPAGRYVYAI